MFESKKETVKHAIIYVKALLPRKRKETFEAIEGIGYSQDEAIEKAKENFEKSKIKYKKFKIVCSNVVDAERTDYGTCELLCAPLYRNLDKSYREFSVE